MLTIINVFLFLLALYFAFGLLFGLYFLFKGAAKIDPVISASKKRVKFLLLPGIVATWPLFILQLIKSKTS